MKWPDRLVGFANENSKAILYSCGVIIFGIIGVILLSSSHATTSTGSQEAENGSTGGCASSLSDSTGSAGGAVKFGACAAGVLGLDETGATIPDTSYTVPPGAIFLATNGSDANAGTQAAPVASLAKAVSLVPSGGTIVAMAGIYHNGEVAASKAFTLQPYPHAQVWFDGLQAIPASSWTSDGSGHWYTDWETPNFCAGKYYNLPYNGQTTPTCSWGTQGGPSDYGDASNPAATDPQMVYINGTYVHEVTALSGVTASAANFWYDQMGTHRIYIGVNPASYTVEATKYANALQLQNSGANGMTIRGVGFRHYATDAYGGNKTHGAVLIGMPNATFEKDVFTQNAGTGLVQVDPINTTIKSSVFAANGFDGFESNGHATSGGATDDITVQDSVFNGNNREHYGCGYACGIANIKLDHMDGAIVKDNVFENGQGGAKGFWCDDGCSNVHVTNNVAKNNAAHGIFYEISDTGIIASNLIYGNGGYGLKLGSANTKVFNNTFVNNAVNLLVYDDPRTQKAGVGPDTTNDQLVNNILYTSNGQVPIQAFNLKSSGAGTAAESYFSAVDYNAFYRTNGSPGTLISWAATSGTSSYSSVAAFHTATGFEANGSDSTATADPYFVNLTSNNYLVRNSSSAYHSGTTIPDDVAAALGISTKTGLSRGAISWPGQ